MAIIDSLVAQLSFDFDDKALKEFDDGMKKASKAVAIVAAGAATAGAAIFAFTDKIAKQNDEVGKLAQTIGVTAQSISELGFVAELNGGSINGMNSSLENLSKTASEAARGLGPGVEAFGLLGISATDANGQIKQTDDLLLDVADAVSQLDSQSQKLELINKLGIDSSLLLSLEQGSEAIRRQREEVQALGFVLDKDATESAANFNDEMLRVGTVIKGISSAIGTKLMKQITPMIKAFLEWFKINKELIKQNLNEFFKTAVKIITTFFNVAKRVVNVVRAITDEMGGLSVALGIAGAAFLAFNARALMIPTIIFAVAAAIFLLIEDLVAFANGAESQIGALAEKFPIVGKAAELIIGILKTLRDIAGGLFTEGISSLDIMLSKFDKLIKKFKDLPVLSQIIDLGYKLSGIQMGGGVETGIAPTFLDNIVAPPVGATTNNNKEVVININGGNVEEVKQAVSEALGAEFKSTELNMSTQTRF